MVISPRQGRQRDGIECAARSEVLVATAESVRHDTETEMGGIGVERVAHDSHAEDTLTVRFVRPSPAMCKSRGR